MSSIGIIANPASGKDIRRLVSYATVIDNNEKVNIVKRIVLGSQALGIDEIIFMPDYFQIGYKVTNELDSKGVLKAKCTILDIPINACSQDSTIAAQYMEKLNVGCIIVLGGDGTSRAVAKGIVNTPILPVSTGTNNVYPSMIEGTVAGMAAAATSLLDEKEEICIKDKCIEVYVNNEKKDIALIDVVISSDIVLGSRAIWDTKRIKSVMVTRCHPASIGFSTIAGSVEIVTPADNYGYSVEVNKKGESYLVPLAAGVLQEVMVSNIKRCFLDQDYSSYIGENCILALDGEREIRLKKGDFLTLKITKSGPYRVITNKVLEIAQKRGMFKLFS
ncbi:ATP-NAD kinase family protein [Terrisporobacter petrolearius]|uniref:ATP-NAD kinase family protein n=1 Tax=Terrisporobacter petrolearius TaxID=1460447 RepID=UPI0031CC93B6